MPDTNMPTTTTSQSHAVAERKERRTLALREAGKETHDAFSAAVHLWAEYTGPDGVPPSAGEAVYHMTFKRLIYPKLKIDQRIKRDDLSRIELMAIIAMEESIATALNDGMRLKETRDDIKGRYKKVSSGTAAVFLPGIIAERGQE